MTGIRTRLLQAYNPTFWPLHHEDFPPLLIPFFFFASTFVPFAIYLLNHTRTKSHIQFHKLNGKLIKVIPHPPKDEKILQICHYKDQHIM